REFWSLPLAVDRRVVGARPPTELLVETALRLAPPGRRVLDCGAGGGAGAGAPARGLPRAAGWGRGRSPQAPAAARANCARHAPHVRLVAGDLLAPVRAGTIGLLVSNPPYCTDADLAVVAPEVRQFEPREALAGGPDGLAVLRRLVADAVRVLAPGGWLLVEIGAGQDAAVRRLFEATGCDTDLVMAD